MLAGLKIFALGIALTVTASFAVLFVGMIYIEEVLGDTMPLFAPEAFWCLVVSILLAFSGMVTSLILAVWLPRIKNPQKLSQCSES